MALSDDRQYAPAALRNRDSILDVFRDVLPMTGVILEIASGSGERIVHFARISRASFSNRRAAQYPRLAKAAAVKNMCTPIALTRLVQWPIASADAVICINMIHISPWEAALGLIKGAAAILPPGAPLYLYGPYTCGVRNGAEPPSIRPKPSQSQPELGSTRSRSGRRDGAIRWILRSGYHRNACKQSERGVPPSLIASLRGRPASERSL
jgi:hypothetical protein